MSSEAWKVRLFHDVHSCIHNGKVEMMKVPVIARFFLEKIRADSDYFMPKKMVSFMFEKWRIKASRDQCQAARKKALRWIRREYDRQFSRLHDYAAEILVSNTNSTIEIGTETNEDIINGSNHMFEVDNGGCSYRVSLDRMFCTCRKYGICGIPCEHACGAILYKKLQREDFVCHWFRTTTWKRNYAEGLVPLRGAQFWPNTCAGDIHKPPPPDMPGRPKKSKEKRIRGRNGSPLRTQPKQLKRVMYCGICGAPNHNSRFHKSGATKPQKDSIVLTQAESSQRSMT